MRCQPRRWRKPAWVPRPPFPEGRGVSGLLGFASGVSVSRLIGRRPLQDLGLGVPTEAQASISKPLAQAWAAAAATSQTFLASATLHVSRMEIAVRTIGGGATLQLGLPPSVRRRRHRRHHLVLQSAAVAAIGQTFLASATMHVHRTEIVARTTLGSAALQLGLRLGRLRCGLPPSFRLQRPLSLRLRRLRRGFRLQLLLRHHLRTTVCTPTS